MTSNSYSSGERLESVPSILLLRLSSLGDIILTTPFIGELRARYPQSRIDIVISKEYESLTSLFIGLTNVHVFDKSTGIQGLHLLRKRLRAHHYSHVLDLHNNLRTRFLRRGIARRTSVVNKRTLKRWMLVKYKYDLLQTEPDVIGRYFKTARSLGVSDSGKGPTLDIATDRDSKRIAIAPGAKHWNKRWPVEYFVKLLNELVTKGYSIDLHGAQHDRDIADEVCRHLPVHSYRNLTGTLTIAETSREIARASLAITNDSGLMHVAQAVGVRTISFFGPTVKQFGFAPRDPQSIVLEVEGLYCRPCTAIGLPNCPEKHFRCMREIGVEQVLLGVDSLLENR